MDKFDFAKLMPYPKKIKRKNGALRVPARFSACMDFESRRVEKALKSSGISVAGPASPKAAALRISIKKTVPELSSTRPELRAQGYVLDICSGSVTLTAVSEQGVYYGLQTLKQMLGFSSSLPAVTITDWPDMPYRGVHCMMGDGTYNFRMMKKCVERMASYKMTHIVIEYDNRFPWERHPKIAHPSAYSKDQIRELVELGRDNFLEVTPCLDSLGHAQHYLWPKEYAHLRENPARTNELCLTDPKAMKFMKELWSEVLEVHQGVKYAHITGDEVSAKLCRSEGKGAFHDLFRDWYIDLSRWIIEHGKVPMMWNDMFVKQPKSLQGFPNDVAICDWCYEAPDQPYKMNQAYFRGIDKAGRVNPLQEKIFAKYWYYKGSKTKFNNFPYVRFFMDRGFEVMGSTASSQTCIPTVIPCQEIRFVNNKRFAMELKARKAAGILVTWWTDELSMESGWLGMLAGADHGWHSRDEKPAAFYNRFGANFLGMRDSETEAIQLIDKHFFRMGKYSGYQKRMWVTEKTESAKAMRVFKGLVPRDKTNAEFKRLMGAQAELVHLQAELGEIYNKIDLLRTGRGRDVPLDISGFARCSYHDSLPVNATEHWDVPPADARVSGVRIKTIDASKNSGKAVVTIKGDRNPDLKAPAEVRGIPVNMKADRLFFFYSGYDIGRDGQHIADIVFNYEDGRTDSLPVVEGRNILDWNHKGGFNKPTPGAVVAWMEDWKYCYFYMGWWVNKRPDVKVVSFDLVSAGNPGYLILGAATARVGNDEGARDEARQLLKELRKRKPLLQKWRRNLDAAFKSVVAKPDFEQRKDGGLIYNKVADWYEMYEKQLIAMGK